MGLIATLANAAYADGIKTIKSSVRSLFAQVDAYVEDLRTRMTSAEDGISSAATAITALLSADTALQAADTAEATARAAGDDARPVYGEASADRDRPGEVRKLWTSTLDGAPSDLTPIAESWVVTSDFGACVRLRGAQYLAPIKATAIEPGRQYRLRAAFKANATTDPDGDTVQIGIRWLDKNKAGLSTTEAVNVLEFSTGAGRNVTSVVVAKTAATGVDVAAPAGAVYMRPFIRTFSADGEIDVDVLEDVDLYDAVDYSPDVEAIENRVATTESDISDLNDLAQGLTTNVSDLSAEVVAARGTAIDLDTRLDTIEQAAAGEAWMRQAADGALGTRTSLLETASALIEAEIVEARGGEDDLDARFDGIEADIVQEIADRGAADTAEAVARTSADAALDGRATALEDEVTAARGGEADIDTRLDAIETSVTDEETARTNADAALDTRLDAAEAEIAAARQGEAAIADNLTAIKASVTSEATARGNADDALDTRLDAVEAEITAARGGEADLDTRLDGIDTDVTAAQDTADTAQSEITAARGGEASLDARLDAIEGLFTDRPALQRLTIADDAATSFTPANGVGRIAVAGPSADLTGDVFFDTASPACAAIVAAADIETATGALTGTDGSDAKLTISAHTDGDVYIENRTGASIDIVVLTIS